MIPWEQRRENGPWRSFRDTLLLSIREPSAFYRLVPEERSSLPALAYGFAFDLVVALATFVHHEAVGGAELQRSLAPLYPQLRQVLPNGPEMAEQVVNASAIVTLLATPLTYLFNLSTTTALTYVGLKLAGGLRTSFGRLLRLFAYASWIQIFGLVAITGDVFLSAIAFLLVLGFGSYYWLVIVRESQGIGSGKAMLASVYGLLVALALACVVGVPLAIGLGVFLASLLPSPGAIH